MEDSIKRSDATEVVYKALRTPPLKGVLTDTMSLAVALVRDIPSADRPQLDEDLVEPIGNGNVIMSEDTYEDLLTDRPQGEWVNALDGVSDHVKCTNCFRTYYLGIVENYNFCPNCGCRMKGADDE